MPRISGRAKFLEIISAIGNKTHQPEAHVGQLIIVVVDFPKRSKSVEEVRNIQYVSLCL